MESGIALAGGGSLLLGLAERLSEETKIHVFVADDPLTCVVRGGGTVLQDLDVYAKVLAEPARRSANRMR
jgi:rod shape-determining protein MreB